jgi:LuxR family transcriptional regulator, quorum-sensing system regulator BjaR1
MEQRTRRCPSYDGCILLTVHLPIERTIAGGRNAMKPRQVDCAFSFIESLNRSANLGTHLASLSRTLATFGLEYFTFQDFPDPARYADFLFCKKVPEEWLKHYIKQEFCRVDPAFRQCQRSIKPFIWAEASYDLEQEPRTTNFIQQVRDFGLDQGLMVPVRNSTGKLGVVWFGGSDPELDKRTIPALHLMALYAFERLRELKPPLHAQKQRLTPREREVLTWIATGKTALEIAELLKITKRTVDHHSQAICRKYGAMNRTHAVALAIRHNAISL